MYDLKLLDESIPLALIFQIITVMSHKGSEDVLLWANFVYWGA